MINVKRNKNKISTENSSWSPMQPIHKKLEKKKVSSTENSSQAPTWPSHPNLDKSEHTKLGETKNKNYFQTWIYLKQIPPQENNKMWGSHQLQNHPRNPSQNPSKRINHPVRIGRRTVWSPWSGNDSSHIPDHNWEWFSTLGPSPTSTSSDRQCGCSWSPKVHPA